VAFGKPEPSELQFRELIEGAEQSQVQELVKARGKAALASHEQRAAEARAIHEERMRPELPPKRLGDALDSALDAVAEKISERNTKPGNPPPLKWRKAKGTPVWVAGEHRVNALKPGKLLLTYAMFELGELRIAGEFPTSAELRAAKTECELRAAGKQAPT
jgi:hypothetical protein